MSKHHSKQIKTGQEFTVSKTDNRFIEVTFTYPSGAIWEGCFPTYYPPASIQFNEADLAPLLSKAYSEMAPTSMKSQIEAAKNKWTKSTQSETYTVFEALLSGKWECRSCGAGKINDQPAARIRDIKKNGFIVATQSRPCATCKKRQYHDILLVFNVQSETRPEFRKPIPASAREDIINTLESTDVFFNSARPRNEFVIDHKFPSQRWTEPETDNEQLSAKEIKDKFQLLTNQSNMLKSRVCDNCCKTGIRPDFLGIQWFYSGDEHWIANNTLGSGCYGCPWFDLKEWKDKLNKKLTKRRPS